MGAVAGIKFTGNGFQSDMFSTMASAMKHRGTRTKSHVYDDSLFIGATGFEHEFLSRIIAKDENRQVCVVIDGELTHITAGHPNGIGQDFSDAQTVLDLYITYGCGFLEYIDGSYAIVIWDGRTEDLVLVRDRVGSRPLFYMQTPQVFGFASEIKGLLASGYCKRTVDLATVNSFLSFGYVPNPKTLFQDIHQVKPGYCLKVSSEKVQEHQYWKFAYHDMPGSLSEAQIQELFWEKLCTAVARRLKRHPDCGAFLSGGLDTSGVVAAMHTLLQHSFKVFTGAFPEKEFDESGDAKVVSDHFGIEHHIVTIQVNEFHDLLKKLVWHHDAPFADTSAIPSYFTARFARTHVNTLLTGDFPDQVLGGSGHHAKALARQSNDTLVHKLLRSRPARAILSQLPLAAGTTSLPDRVKRFLYRESHSFEEQRHILDMPLPDTLKQWLYSPDMLNTHKNHHPLDLARSIYNACSRDNLLDRLLFFDTLSYAPDDLMVKVERMTMAHGLNALSPFHDREWIEFAACLPANMKIRDLQRKYVMREALRPYLPGYTLEKKKKGFDMPIGEWLIKRYADYVKEILLDGKTLKRGYFKPDFLETLVTNFLSEKTDYATGSDAAIISLLTLELWHRIFIDV